MPRYLSNTRLYAYLAARGCTMQPIYDEKAGRFGLRLSLHGRTMLAWFEGSDLEFCSGPVIEVMRKLVAADCRYSRYTIEPLQQEPHRRLVAANSIGLWPPGA